MFHRLFDLFGSEDAATAGGIFPPPPAVDTPTESEELSSVTVNLLGLDGVDFLLDQLHHLRLGRGA
jgi:hypothetical protein